MKATAHTRNTRKLQAHQQDMVPTTLVEAIAAVPQLGNKCSSVLTDGGMGSGLKTMRRVSKQIRAAMLGVVQGYTLTLDGGAVGMMSELSLLQGARLSCLRVVVIQGADGVFPGGLSGWSAHSRHLRMFLSEMGPAIRSITRLELESTFVYGNSTEAVAVLLTQLAPACPALQQLRVTGDIGRPVFAALGASCNSLSCLELMRGVSDEAIKHLHLLLPRLTRARYTDARVLRSNPLIGYQLCNSLSESTSLTHLDIGPSILSQGMWDILPIGLRELHCSLQGDPPKCEGHRTYPALQHIKSQCGPGRQLKLSVLAAVLRLAPALQSVSLTYKVDELSFSGILACSVAKLSVNCSPNSIPDLIFVHERVMAGLSVTAALHGEKPVDGTCLFVKHNAPDQASQECEVEEFMLMLPPLPAVNSLVLWSVTGQSSIPSITQGITSSFPNLTSLSVELHTPVSNADLLHLSSLTGLQHLALDEACVTTASLLMLCNRMPQLQSLCLQDCEGLDVSDGEELQQVLHDWGLAVKVKIVHTGWM